MRGLIRPDGVQAGAGGVGLSFEHLPAIGRIGEPVAAVGMRDHVIGRVQLLPVVLVGDDGGRAVELVAHDAARQVLARNLAALEVERIAVAVVRRVAEHGDAVVVLEPAHLHVVADVAEHEIAADTAPRGALEPQAAGPQALDRVVRQHDPVERRVHGEDVRIRKVRRRLAEIARRIRDDRRRRRALREQRVAGERGAGHGAERLDGPAARNQRVFPFVRARHQRSSLENQPLS